LFLFLFLNTKYYLADRFYFKIGRYRFDLFVGFGFVSVNKSRKETDNAERDNHHNEYASRGIHNVLSDKSELRRNACLTFNDDAVLSALGYSGDL
jgi:hypothetical protein